MSKVTSTDIINAIQFAKSHPQISQALQRRDRDERLDCLEIKCRVISAVNAATEEFAMIFNYGDIGERRMPGIDIVVNVISEDGEMRI